MKDLKCKGWPVKVLCRGELIVEAACYGAPWSQTVRGAGDVIGMAT